MIGTDANPGATSPGAHRFCRRRHTLPLSLSSNQPVPVDAFCGAICHLDRMCPVQRRCCLRQGRQWLWPVRAGEHPRKSSTVKATESFLHRCVDSRMPGWVRRCPRTRSSAGERANRASRQRLMVRLASEARSVSWPLSTRRRTSSSSLISVHCGRSGLRRA